MARRNIPALVQPVPQKHLLSYWHEEIVNLAYHLVKSQVIQDQSTEQLVEGLLSQYTPQSVLSFGFRASVGKIQFSHSWLDSAMMG